MEIDEDNSGGQKCQRTFLTNLAKCDTRLKNKEKETTNKKYANEFLDVQSCKIERTYEYSRVGKNKARIKNFDHNFRVIQSSQNGDASGAAVGNHKNDWNKVRAVQLCTREVE